MFVFKLLPVLFPLQMIFGLTAIEDKYLTNQLREYFDEDYLEKKSEIIAVGNQKRSAEPSIDDDDKISSLLSSFNLTSRANHYWTRKRGRDQTTLPSTIWDIYYTLYPTRKTSITVVDDENTARKKRESVVNFLTNNKISSRIKRDIQKVIDDTKDTKDDEKSEIETSTRTSKPCHVLCSRQPVLFSGVCVSPFPVPRVPRIPR